MNASRASICIIFGALSLTHFNPSGISQEEDGLEVTLSSVSTVEPGAETNLFFLLALVKPQS